MEDHRIKYIKVINKVIAEQEDIISDANRAVLNQAIGYIYQEIAFAGKMTKELARELNCECLWKE